jgi:hypothetical protein
MRRQDAELARQRREIDELRGRDRDYDYDYGRDARDRRDDGNRYDSRTDPAYDGHDTRDDGYDRSKDSFSRY